MFQDTKKGRAAEVGLCVSQTEIPQTKCRFAPGCRLERKPLVGPRLQVSLKTESEGVRLGLRNKTVGSATKAAGGRFDDSVSPPTIPVQSEFARAHSPRKAWRIPTAVHGTSFAPATEVTSIFSGARSRTGRRVPSCRSGRHGSVGNHVHSSAGLVLEKQALQLSTPETRESRNHPDVVFVEKLRESALTDLFNRWTDILNGPMMALNADCNRRGVRERIRWAFPGSAAA